MRTANVSRWSPTTPRRGVRKRKRGKSEKKN
jgi:hypothetical protein